MNDLRESNDQMLGIIEEALQSNDEGRYPEIVAELAAQYPFFYDQFEVAKVLKKISFAPAPSQGKAIAQYFYRAGDGGIERVLIELAKLFHAEGKDSVILISEDMGKDSYEIPSGVSCETVPLFGIGCTDKDALLQRYESLQRSLRNNNIDTYICHPWLGVVCIWDLLLCRLLGIRFILVTHGVFSHPVTLDSVEHACFALLPHLCSLCDAVVCLTETNKQYYSRFNSNSFAIPNPVPSSMKDYVGTHGISASGTSPSEPTGDRKIFWIGRLDDSKRPLDAVRIMEKIVKQVPDTKLVFVGKSADGRFEKAVGDEAKRLRIEDKIELRGYTNDIMPCYEESDLILFTTEIEGSPMVLLESAAAGRPVVMYDLPFLSTATCTDWISFAPQQDLESAANVLIKLLKDDEMRLKRGAAARNYAKELIQFDLAGAWEKAFTCPPRNANVFEREDLEATVWTTLYEHSMRGSRQIDALRASRDAAVNETAQTEKRIRREFESSRTWKLGRTITALPRKLLGRP